MPNWVDNKLTIEADKVTIDNIFNKIKSQQFNDSKVYQIALGLYPMPNDITYVMGTGGSEQYAVLQDKIVRPPSVSNFVDRNYDERLEFVDLTEVQKKDLNEKHGATNWYDWNVKNYGTKWGDCSTELINHEESKLEFVFESPWSHSAVLAQRISEDYKASVELKHYSIENWEKGMFLFEEGTLHKSEYELLGDPDEVLVPVSEEE